MSTSTPVHDLGVHLRQTRLRAGLSVPAAVAASGHAAGMVLPCGGDPKRARGVSRPFVYMIEAGTRRPSGETLATLLHVYGATSEEADTANRIHAASAPAEATGADG